MSFNNPFTDDLEAGDAASAHYNDFPEFETLSRAIDKTLSSINNSQLVSIRNLLQQQETLQDSDTAKALKVSSKISELISKCTDSYKQINETTQKLNSYLNLCESNHEDEDTLKYLRQKEGISVSLVKSSLIQFQKLQKKFDAIERKTLGSAAPIDADPTSSFTAGPEQQQVQITYEPVNAEELEQQTLLIEEREREIQQISHDTQEINDIFLNLQDIIQEQLFQIDTIEDNILSYSTDVRGASRELRKAERYQKRAGGRMLCCLLILIGVFGSVILIGLIF